MILWLCFSFVGLATARLQCSGVMPPGLDKLRKGVDITTVDMLPLDITQPQGFKGLIVDYTCQSPERQWRNPYSREMYQIPDEIEMTSLPGGVMNNHVEIHKSAHSVSKSMAGEMGVDFLEGMFSGSASAMKMSHTMTNRSRFVADVSAFHSAYRADMAPYWFLNISRHAKFFIDRRLPESYSANPAAYAEFIRYFGTHYFIQAKFGGLIRDYMEIETSLLTTMSESEVKANAAGSYFKIIKASGGYHGTTTRTSQTFESKTQHFVKYYGGNANFFGNNPQEAWQAWENSVSTNPWMFSGQLAPLSNLVQNPNKKQAMATAIREHIDRAFLNEAEAHYHTLLSKTTDSTVRAKLLSELRSISTLKSLPFGSLKADNSVLLRIKSAIARPNWFLHNTKLCYYWYPDGNGGQCGGGAGRNLCAQVNSYTAWYRDDTDKRPGGCRMKWGIVSDGFSHTDSWFSNVKLCYQWYPDGNGGQCGGGAPRLTCAPVGQFTHVYRDDTDRRPGGCRMRWKLDVPANAPLWIRTAKLCYEWYPDGDGGQCGGGVARKLCAAVNQWTTYYRDDSDRRGGGCRMRWGIMAG